MSGDAILVALGTGELRRDPRFAQAYVGRAVIAGYPYRLTGVLEADEHGSRLALRFAAETREAPA